MYPPRTHLRFFFEPESPSGSGPSPRPRFVSRFGSRFGFFGGGGRRGARVGEGRYTVVLESGDDVIGTASFDVRRDPMLDGATPAEIEAESLPEIRD